MANLRKPNKRGTKKDWLAWFYENPLLVAEIPDNKLPIGSIIVSVLSERQFIPFVDLTWLCEYELEQKFIGRVLTNYFDLFTEDMFKLYFNKKEIYELTDRFDHLFQSQHYDRAWTTDFENLLKERGSTISFLSEFYETIRSRNVKFSLNSLVFIFRMWPELILNCEEMNIPKTTLTSDFIQRIRLSRPEIDKYLLLVL